VRPRTLSVACLRALALAPLCWWTARRTARRMAWRGWRAPVPVISVDSLFGEMAQTGALAVIGQLREMGLSPLVLMGGETLAPFEVDVQKHTYADVGGAALLAAAFAPTWVAADPVEAARVALLHTSSYGSPPKCIVMVGESYNPNAQKDISITIVDAARGFGNGMCRPAGPLPEPLEQALARVDICLTIGPPALQEQFAAAWGQVIPAQNMRARMEALPTGMDWRGLRALAFTGGRAPEHFVATLRGLGAEVARAATLSAGAPVTRALVTRLRNEAALLGAQLVTTEADAVRLPDDLRREVLVLPMRLRVEDWGALEAALDRLGMP
jgi:tetraacyldisaccharide 4'-kinase